MRYKCLILFLIFLPSLSFSSGIIINTSTVDNSLGSSNSRNLVLDKFGNFYVAYVDEYKGNSHIFVSCSKDGGKTWDKISQEPVDQNGNYNQGYPALAIDDENNLHLVWQGYSEFSSQTTNIWYSCFQKISPAFSQWTPPYNLTREKKFDQCAPSISLDSEKNIYVAWYGFSAQYPENLNIMYCYFNKSKKIWSSSVFVTRGNVYQQSIPQIVADSQNKVHFVWHGFSAQYPKHWNIYYSCLEKGNISSSLCLTKDENFDQGNPSLAIDNLDNLHIVWNGTSKQYPNFNIKYICYNNLTSEWLQPVAITTSKGYDQFQPSITIDSKNCLHVFWRGINENFSKSQIFYSRYDEKMQWSTPLNLTSGEEVKIVISRFSKNFFYNPDSISYIWSSRSNNFYKIYFDQIILRQELEELSFVEKEISEVIEWKPPITQTPPLEVIEEKEVDSYEGMVYVPEGSYILGSEIGEDDEKPVQEMWLDSFYIDKYPVTNAQYYEFINQTSYPAPTHWKNRTYPEGKENHPVVNVTLADAYAYAQWAGKRIPTEFEWEKAARGIDGRIYPWGNDWDINRCNSFESRIKTTTPVDKYPLGVSPYGCYDLAGNVWEWTSSYYLPYSGNQTSNSNFGEKYQVIRGGSWGNNKYSVRCSRRGYRLPITATDYIGFRCVKDVENEK